MKNIPPGDREKVYGPEYVSRELEIGGFVARPRVFTSDELRTRPGVILEEVPLICGSGRVKDRPRRLSGVLLQTLLDETEILIPSHEDPNRTFIVARGKDGYTTLFSWHEIFNTPGGEKLLVVLEKDGRVLGEDEGELCLVSVGDERPGPRRVRYLYKIEVCRYEK